MKGGDTNPLNEFLDWILEGKEDVTWALALLLSASWMQSPWEQPQYATIARADPLPAYTEMIKYILERQTKINLSFLKLLQQ